MIGINNQNDEITNQLLRDYKKKSLDHKTFSFKLSQNPCAIKIRIQNFTLK